MDPIEFIGKYTELDQRDEIHRLRCITETADLIVPTTWEFRRDLAELVGTIKFPCGFKNGTCISYKKWAKKDPITPRAGCCSMCYDFVGHFITIENQPDIIKEIAEPFKEGTGFWDENVGCLLPWKYRSSVCLIHLCNDVELTSYRDKLLMSFFIPDKKKDIDKTSGPKLARIYYFWRENKSIAEIEKVINEWIVMREHYEDTT